MARKSSPDCSFLEQYMDGVEKADYVLGLLVQ